MRVPYPCGANALVMPAKPFAGSFLAGAWRWGRSLDGSSGDSRSKSLPASLKNPLVEFLADLHLLVGGIARSLATQLLPLLIGARAGEAIAGPHPLRGLAQSLGPPSLQFAYRQAGAGREMLEDHGGGRVELAGVAVGPLQGEQNFRHGGMGN